jgi:hypothetical protein
MRSAAPRGGTQTLHIFDSDGEPGLHCPYAIREKPGTMATRGVLTRRSNVCWRTVVLEEEVCSLGR